MADTLRASIPDAPCDDCGVRDVSFQHWGPLVPSGTRAKLCSDCWEVRKDRGSHAQPVLPLGQTSYAARGLGKFLLLKFPDRDMPHEPHVVSTKELANTLMHGLQCPVAHKQGATNLCEFFWQAWFDRDRVNTCLNELRRQYPQMAVIIQEHSIFHPQGH